MVRRISEKSYRGQMGSKSLTVGKPMNQGSGGGNGGRAVNRTRPQNSRKK